MFLEFQQIEILWTRFLRLCFLTNIRIYIHTIQQLRYPGETLPFFAYIPGAIRTMQHIP